MEEAGALSVYCEYRTQALEVEATGALFVHCEYHTQDLEVVTAEMVRDRSSSTPQ